MKGIIFVVWEKYLNERFGKEFLGTYRHAIGEASDQLPVTGRTYPDERLVAGVNAASKLTLMSQQRLLFEYGRYFMINGLVEYLCGYLLAQAWSGYDLLLYMRDAHAQMRRTPDGLTPPLFEYDVLSDDHQHMLLTYDSNRQLCGLLEGCIHGAAERFGEKVVTKQVSCTLRGDPVCRFDVQFHGESWAKRATRQQIQQESERLSKQGITNLVLQLLSFSSKSSMTLDEIKLAIEQQQGSYFPEIYQKQQVITKVHISQLYTALSKLEQVGLVASTAHQNDTFNTRRYWRAPTSDEQLAAMRTL